MTEPLLSVLMPIRNGAQYLDKALGALLAIDAELELLIQDALSTDGTEDVVLARADSRVAFVSEIDRGQADALNRALERARGRWVLWCNADDTLDPRAVERLLPMLDETPANIVYGDFAIIDADGRSLRRYTSPTTLSQRDMLTRGQRIFSGSMLIRRSFLVAENGFDERYHYCMDYELFVRLAPRAHAVYVPGAVGSLRLHSSSKSIAQPWEFVREYRAIHAQHRQPRWQDRAAAQFERARIVVFTLAAPLRYSRLWSRFRPAKSL